MRTHRARDLAVFWGTLAFVLLMVVVAANTQTRDGRWSDWFKSLRDADGRSCCDLSDCARTRSRSGPSGYQAQTPAGVWVDIPDSKIIRRENPTGEPVMCWLPDRGVVCFVRGIEA